MYKRMLDKSHEPTLEEIITYIGDNSSNRLNDLTEYLYKTYNANKSLKFPFGNNYGWGYKYSVGSKHLFYLFFEDDALNAMIQIGSGTEGDKLFSEFSEYAQELWKDRYPCGDNGGWIHYRILDDKQIDECKKIIDLKCMLSKVKKQVNHA